MVKKTSDNNKDAIILSLIFVAVVIIGMMAYLIMRNLANKNRLVCTYIGRLWMPDKYKNEPGFYKCYTYKEYYAYEE